MDIYFNIQNEYLSRRLQTCMCFNQDTAPIYTHDKNQY